MGRLIALARRLIVAEDGPTTVEYAIMLALIITVCVSTISALGVNTKKVCDTICTVVYGS
jgi:pilus assembly protein Flp/PilA